MILDCYKKVFARKFNGSSNELTYSGAILDAYPISMACWFNTDITNADETLISIGRSGSANNFISLRLSQATDQVQIFVQNSGGSNNALSTGTYKANRWHHAGCRGSLTSRFAYIDGEPGTENTSSRAYPTVNITSIGSRYNSTAGNFMSGMIALPAIWNIELTHADFALLATGVDPRTVHPENLVAFWDWTGAETEYGIGL